jgi:hypothetical protein
MSTVHTVQNLFGHRNLREVLYVVKSPESVVYVGMARTQCVCDRMARHIGDVFAKDNPSRFSALLFQNHPHYFSWKVDVLSRSEAEKITKDGYDCLPCAERGLYDFFSRQQGKAPNGNAKRPSHRCENAT